MDEKKDIEHKVATGVYILRKKETTRSAIWRVFSTITATDGSINKSYIWCNKCRKACRFETLKPNTNVNANIYSHRCYKELRAEKYNASILANCFQELDTSTMSVDSSSVEGEVEILLIEGEKSNVDTPVPKSPVWQSFSLTIDDGGYTAESVISCLQCKMVIEYNDNKKGLPHKCIAEDGRKWSLVTPNRSEIAEKLKSEIATRIRTGVYKLQMNRKGIFRSTAWKVFVLIVKNNGCIINGYYHCLKCKRILKSGFKTNGLNEHKCLVDIKMQKASQNIGIEEVESKLKSGIYKMKPTKRTNPIWKRFALISKDNSKCTVKGMICCRYCKSVLKCKDDENENTLKQHKCVERMQNRRKQNKKNKRPIKRLHFDNDQEQVVYRVKKTRANVKKDQTTILSDDSNTSNSSLTLGSTNDKHNLEFKESTETKKLSSTSGKIPHTQKKSCVKKKCNTIINEDSQQSFSSEFQQNLQPELNDIHSNETIEIKEEEPRYFDIMNNTFNETYCINITGEIDEVICLDSSSSCDQGGDKDNDFKESHQRRINYQGEYKNLVQEFNEIHSNETSEIKGDEEPNHFDLTETTFNEIDETICLDSPYSWNEDYQDNVIKETKNICMQWFIEDLAPLTKLEAASFHTLINYWLQLGASYGENVEIENTLPNASTLARHIKQRAEIKKSEIIFKINEILKNFENLAISLDICLDNIIKKKFLFATLHLVENGEIFDICLGVKSMDFSQTSPVIIRNKLESLFSNFDINNLKDLVFVTEGDSDMMEEALDSCIHLKCSRYLFSKVLDAAIDSTEELRDIIKRCKVIRKHFTTSNQLNLIELDISHYELFKSITLNWRQINDLLAVKKETIGVSNACTATLQSLVKFFQRFEFIFKHLQETQSPTLCFVIPSIQRLKMMCTAKSNDFADIKTFKTNLLKFIEEIWLANVGIWHKAACFLYPPANQMQENHLNEIKDFCLQQMKLLTPISAENDSTTLDENVDSTANNADYMDFFFPNLFKSPDLQSTTANNAEEEFNRYCREKILIDTSFNALQWWHNNSTKYPLLSRLALQVLSIPACTAKSIRVLPVKENMHIISTEISENISLLNSLRQK